VGELDDAGAPGDQGADELPSDVDELVGAEVWSSW
jgi:hypothetical protein